MAASELPPPIDPPADALVPQGTFVGAAANPVEASSAHLTAVAPEVAAIADPVPPEAAKPAAPAAGAEAAAVVDDSVEARLGRIENALGMVAGRLGLGAQRPSSGKSYGRPPDLDLLLPYGTHAYTFPVPTSGGGIRMVKASGFTGSEHRPEALNPDKPLYAAIKGVARVSMPIYGGRTPKGEQIITGFEPIDAPEVRAYRAWVAGTGPKPSFIP